MNSNNNHHHLEQQNQKQIDLPNPPNKQQQKVVCFTAFAPISPPLSHSSSPSIPESPQPSPPKVCSSTTRRPSPTPLKLRSRSLPNLLKLDSLNSEQAIIQPSPTSARHTHHIHLHHSYRHRKHVNAHKKGSLSFSKSSSHSLLLHSPISVVSIKSANTTKPPAPTTPFVYDPSMPLDLMPPVNTTSLREIDLQEIFKNPQLRHDIVFDPQLQFRPNLDGERGKRKRASTEKYWDTIVAELDALAASTDGFYTINSDSKLPYLFISMRDILDSLLPIKDRSYVDSVLDPELLLRQLRHCALDFVGLANWLSSVFKAHCAPMRDSWVDQMVSRIESGVVSRSPRRIVEGLRMTFAILEAMKLDVANHQIRTLRPVLVDTAIEFEQGYYHQIIEKGKFNLQDSLLWYNKNLQRYKEKLQKGPQKSAETHRSAFCYGLTMLLSCASEEIVTEFPSSFGFDFARLADFRAEVRQIVCMHLCVTLFQQLLQGRLAKLTTLPVPQRKAMMTAALAAPEIEKMKTDILAIIGDAYGNTKWTKNTSTLALELAKRVETATSATPSFVPDADLVDMASGWLAKHLQPKSPVYKLVESKVTSALVAIGCKSMNALSALEQAPALSSLPSVASSTSTPVGPAQYSVEWAAKKEIDSLATKVLVLIRFHWGVFGKYYIAFATLGDSTDSQYSSTSSLGVTQNPASASSKKRLQSSSSASTSTTSPNSTDNEITQSL